MILPIETLYEISFNLIYQLRLQPSEVNNLTVPESRSYIKFYNNAKLKEREAIQAAKEANNNSSTPRKASPKQYVRHRKRR